MWTIGLLKPASGGEEEGGGMAGGQSRQSNVIEQSRRTAAPIVCEKVVNGELVVSLRPSPKQRNGSDCGVYASAVTFQWAQGKSLPSSWDVSGMRQSCLENAAVQSFREGPRRKGRRTNTVSIAV